jgi:hypothetical protein
MAFSHRIPGAMPSGRPQSGQRGAPLPVPEACGIPEHRNILYVKENERTMAEKRKNSRKSLIITTVIRKMTNDGSEGNYEIMEFRTRDVSAGGIFISTEDLSLFDLDEEMEILVDDVGERYYEGRARIVRSARIFTEEGNPVESGFGLMFLSPDAELSGMISRKPE